MPINITGVDSTLRAIRKFDPDLNKALNREIKAAMIPIRNTARGYLPENSSVLSGWRHSFSMSETTDYRAFPFYDNATAKAGIVYRQGKNKRMTSGFQVGYYVANRSASGAIYETAGRLPIASSKSESLNPNARAQFLAPLPKLYGKDKQRGRLIYRAWDEDYGHVTLAISKAINDAISKFNQSSFGLAS
jgi:hypothetical protein